MMVQSFQNILQSSLKIPKHSFIQSFRGRSLVVGVTNPRSLTSATNELCNKKIPALNFNIASSSSIGVHAFSTKVTPSDTSKDTEEEAPTLAIARSMQTSFKVMDNKSLILLAAIESPPIKDARAEVLKRHIMSVDSVDYKTATEKFIEIENRIRTYSRFSSIPPKLGVFAAVTAGFASFPFVFDLKTAVWFNEHYVTTDVPEPRDLETWLEVGSWSWNWMEPVMGQISFFLLCMQFARSQIQNLGFRPYYESAQRKISMALCEEFPQYDKHVLVSFSESVKLYSN